MSDPCPSPVATSTLPRQHAVYQKYLVLQSIAPQCKDATLGGTFVVSSGMGREGTELAMASTIAGAAFLGIEPSPQRLKATLRNNACDFMVNALDEALRVLKNEVRKRQPISVGLLGNAAEILPQMAERGVQPDLLSDTSPLDTPADYVIPPRLRTAEHDADVAATRSTHLAAIVCMAERGAILMDFVGILRAALASIQAHSLEVYAALASSKPCDSVTSETKDATESCVYWTAGSSQNLKDIDMLVASLLPPEDAVRLRWLEGAAGCFHRQTPLQRVICLRPSELASLLQSLQEPAFRNRLQQAVELHWHNAEGSSQTTKVQPFQPISAG